MRARARAAGAARSGPPAPGRRAGQRGRRGAGGRRALGAGHRARGQARVTGAAAAGAGAAGAGAGAVGAEVSPSDAIRKGSVRQKRFSLALKLFSSSWCVIRPRESPHPVLHELSP